MRTHGRFICLTFVVWILAAVPTPTGDDAPGKSDARPVLIPGVPFVSIQEAVREPQIGLQPVRCRASQMTLVRYYEPDAENWEACLKAVEEEGHLRERWDDMESMEELYELVSDGNPVLVATSTTPYAHELYPMWVMLADAGGELGVDFEKLAEEDLSSGSTLPRMVGLDVQDAIREGLGKTISLTFNSETGEEETGTFDFNPINEIVFACYRVVLGMDPGREVVTLHDPVFGPAWEVPYEDFITMWEATDRRSCVLEPKDAAPASEIVGEAYRQRTTDEKAAELYLYGYSLAATGKADEAEKLYRAGLRLPGVSKGYRCLFLTEQGYIAYREHGIHKALALLQDAASELPEWSVPWIIMAQVCRETGAAGGQSTADEFEKKATKLNEAENVFENLGRNFASGIWELVTHTPQPVE